MQHFAANPESFGQAIRALRLDRGLTQAELAEACVLRPATVSAAENGSPGTRAETIFRLLGALGREMHLRDRQEIRRELGIPDAVRHGSHPERRRRAWAAASER